MEVKELSSKEIFFINKKKFDSHIQTKIDKLGERIRYINYKFTDVRYYFRKYNITIIYLATLLTLIEAYIGYLSNIKLENTLVNSFIRMIPLILSSSISLLAALIKFNKYEDKIENITRTTEKCIITMAKLKNIKEKLYFSNSNKNIAKLVTIFLDNIYGEYLDSNKNIEKELIDSDYVKYMNKIVNNDIRRNKIILEKEYQLKKNYNYYKLNKQFCNIYEILNRFNFLNNKTNKFQESKPVSPRQNRLSINSIPDNITIKVQNEDDNLSIDVSQFAPSSKGNNSESFVGSINSILDNEFSLNSPQNYNKYNHKNNSEVINNLKNKFSAKKIQRMWKKSNNKN